MYSYAPSVNKVMAPIVPTSIGLFSDLNGNRRNGEPLIDNPPKSSYRLRFVVKEVLEESTRIEGRWIGISLSLLAKFSNPILWFSGVFNLEEAS
jgi:hypothetical protein